MTALRLNLTILLRQGWIIVSTKSDWKLSRNYLRDQAWKFAIM